METKVSKIFGRKYLDLIQQLNYVVVQENVKMTIYQNDVEIAKFNTMRECKAWLDTKSEEFPKK